MGFSYDFGNGKMDVIYHCEEEKPLDWKVWEVMPHLSQLLPARMRQRGNYYDFIYDISGTTNLLAWLEDAFPSQRVEMEQKKEDAFQSLLDAGISAEQLLQKERCMYVENSTDAIKMICIPLAVGERCETPPVPAADQPLDLYFMQKKTEPQVPPEGNWNETPRWTGTQEPQESPAGRRNESSGSSEAQEPQESPESRWNESSGWTGAQEPEPQVSSENGWNERLRREVRQELDPREEDGEDGTVLYREEPANEDEKTVMLVSRPSGRAKLIRLEPQEVFTIVKNTSKIGRKKETADICLKGNPTLGREHCMIHYLNGKYYLEDNNSRNATWLDGKRLEPGKPAVLHHKSRIRLSNEEFIFENEEEQS